MLLSGRTSEIERARIRRNTAKIPRPGMPIPGLSMRGRLPRSNILIWLLAVCIAVALILKATMAAGAQQRLWEPHDGVISFDRAEITNTMIVADFRGGDEGGVM